MDKEFIRHIVRETIKELNRNGLLRVSELAYAEITSVLIDYYRNGEVDEKIKKAIADLETDPYFRVIPLYFENGYKMESIAEEFGVDTSTIARNKKRLCLAIYERI